MTRQEAFQILGINSTTDVEEIKQAYKKQAKKYHPDIYHGDKKFAEEKMKQINEAYAILSQPNNSSYSQNYDFDEYMRAKKQRDEYWQKVQEELERLQKEMEEENRKMKKMFKPIFILLIISCVIAFIFLLTTSITSAISDFNQANWFAFGFQLIVIIVSILFGFVCFAGATYMWKKMFKE